MAIGEQNKEWAFLNHRFAALRNTIEEERTFTLSGNSLFCM